MENSLQFLQEMFSAVMQAKSAGPLALVATCVMFSIRLVSMFAPGVLDKVPPVAKPAVPFSLAFLGAFVAGLGSGVVPALGAALVAGLGAIGLHHGSKAVGAQLAPKLSVPVGGLREKALQLLVASPKKLDNVIPIRGEDAERQGK